MIRPYFFNRTEYILYHKIYGSLIITEPIGWRDDGKEFARNKNYDGIFTKFSNNLKFIDNGYHFLKSIYLIYGIEAKVRLIKNEMHPKTDEWTRSYSGFLDMSTYKDKDNEISVKFNSSGLEQTLKARQNEKIEVERLTDLDGNEIPELQTENIVLNGKRIFLKSNWETKNTENNIRLEVYSDDGNVRDKLESVPLNLITTPYEGTQSSFYDVEHGEGSASTGNMFIAVVDREHTYKVKVNLTFKLKIDRREHISWSFFRVCLTKYKNGINYDNPERINLIDNDGGWSFNNQILTATFDDYITLETDESLALEFFIKADFTFNLLNRQRFYLECQDIVCNVSTEEDNHFDKTSTKVIMAHELGQRITKIITGKDAFYSEFLGRTDIGYQQDGKGALNGYANGMMIRGFDKLPLPQEATATTDEVINKYKPFTISFKKWFENEQVINNVGLGIEKIGLTEKIVIKERKEFYNPNITIRLGKVKNLERTVNNDWNFSGLEFGFEKGVDNEEAMGLDDPHGKLTYITYLKRITKTYSKVSKVIWSDYAREFIRRKPKALNETEDHKNDKEIFGINLKRGNLGFEERRWQDDFEQEPKRIFSPETSTNLSTTPLNVLLKHAMFFTAGFTKYLDKYIRYGSSTANSNLKTQLIGGVEYSENEEKILNGDLEKARFVSETIKFEYPVNFELSQIIEDTTIINGKEVLNVYGLVEFINNENEKETGYLLNFKPNNNSWEIIKANRK